MIRLLDLSHNNRTVSPGLSVKPPFQNKKIETSQTDSVTLRFKGEFPRRSYGEIDTLTTHQVQVILGEFLGVSPDVEQLREAFIRKQSEARNMVLDKKNAVLAEQLAKFPDAGNAFERNWDEAEKRAKIVFKTDLANPDDETFIKEARKQLGMITKEEILIPIREAERLFHESFSTPLQQHFGIYQEDSEFDEKMDLLVLEKLPAALGFASYDEFNLDRNLRTELDHGDSQNFIEQLRKSQDFSTKPEEEFTDEDNQDSLFW